MSDLDDLYGNVVSAAEVPESAREALLLSLERAGFTVDAAKLEWRRKGDVVFATDGNVSSTVQSTLYDLAEGIIPLPRIGGGNP